MSEAAPGGDGKVGLMKYTVCQLIVFVSAMLLCALTSPVLGQNENAAASEAKETVAIEEKAAVPETKEKAASAESSASVNSGIYQYFEYQVITVPKKVLATAAESMKLPKDSQPSDELLPAIYKAGGYRVIGYSAGYADANSPVEFKMSRSEFFPDFYILPKEQSDVSYVKNNNPGEIPPPDMDDEEDKGYDGAEDDEEDEEYAEDEEYEEDDGSSDFMNSYNNLAGVFPFFGDPTTYGNEFFLDIRPPRIFSLESTMRKLNGFSNTDYGDWGEAQSPVFDDNSFANTLSSTKGKPMIIAKSSTSNAWTLHVFFTKALPAPENLTPATGSENKLVRLDFQIVRAKWNELCVAGESDGCPGLPSEKILGNLSKSSQLRDLYSPTFRLVPSQEPVYIRLNSKTQSVPLKWIPAQDPGVQAIPLNNENIWTGTVLQASARILGDGSTVRLDYRFEKTSQTGWRNYGYSFYDEPQEDSGPTIIVQNDRYARPQPQPLFRQPEPEIRTALLKLPMIDTTAFRQALFLEVGKPVLAARISNPAYQPDMLTLLFVTATVEDAP